MSPRRTVRIEQFSRRLLSIESVIDLIIWNMEDTMKKQLEILMAEYPKPTGSIIGYGTAGFRTRADLLPWIMIRIGILASLRSKLKRGKWKWILL